MSRIGKHPVTLPKGVTCSLSGRTVTVQGPKGTLSIEHRPEVKVAVEGNRVTVTRDDDLKASKAYHGLTRALIQNMALGVSEGYKKELEVVGAGWSAQVQGKKLNLKVGYADTRVVDIPDGITVAVAGMRITISGVDKQLVGEVAARTRRQRPPEPYNGKGIKYVDEVIIRKEGKAFAGTK